MEISIDGKKSRRSASRNSSIRRRNCSIFSNEVPKSTFQLNVSVMGPDLLMLMTVLVLRTPGCNEAQYLLRKERHLCERTVGHLRDLAVGLTKDTGTEKVSESATAPDDELTCRADASPEQCTCQCRCRPGHRHRTDLSG